MPTKSPSVPIRVLGWLGFHVLSVAAAALQAGKVDVILAPSPPLTIGVVAWLIGLIKRAPFVYNVQELFPDAVVSLGALSDGPVLSLLQRMEKFVYRHSFAVTTIAPGMARAIKERIDQPRKVRLIPNFVDVSVITPRPRDNSFSREHGLTGRFTVLYAGNMGPAQDLETLLEAAALTREDPRILYVLVGEGTSRRALQETAKLRKLENVMFIPQQPFDRVPDIYGASDLAVVPLARALSTEAVPSKVYRIMAADRRVLALADPESDVADLVRESGAGIVIPAGDAEKLAKAVVAAAATTESASAGRGRPYVAEHFDRQAITRQYSRLLDEAASSRST